MTQPDRRRREVRLPASADRRQGDRRGRQAAVLDHRRATDRRLDAAGASLLLQRSAFVRQAGAPRPAVGTSPAAASPSPSAAPPPRVLELDAPHRAPLDVLDLPDDDCTELVACPLCSVLFDPLWLFRHVAVAHSSWRAGERVG